MYNIFDSVLLIINSLILISYKYNYYETKAAVSSREEDPDFRHRG